MSIFDPAPFYRTSTPAETAGLALSLPLTPLNNLGQQFQQGVVDSFGLGTAIKDFTTPRGIEAPPGPDTAPTGFGPAAIVTGAYEALRGQFGAKTTGAPIAEADWKASEFYRPEIKWDAGMTTDRAAAIARQVDMRNARSYFGSKDWATTLIGQFGGGALDPINYVPVFGPAARVAAAAKFGMIAGHVLIGASEAAINTAVFGALTSQFRGRLGEDVSIEASINNIAFAAVAGAVFGGIGGAWSKVTSARALAAERDARIGVETVRNVAAARDVLNDAIASLEATGEVRLSPKSQSTLERLAADVTDRRVASRALDTETAGVTGTKPGEVAIAPSGARVAVRPELVEASSLQRATGALQVRDRSASNAASNTQIQDIAINLDPAKLMPAVDASQGAPIVGPDNVVDSGNGRVAAISLAYDAYPERAAAYRQALVDAGYPEAATMEKPVLVSRRTTPLSNDARAQFNADVNGPTTARMSAVELANLDRGALTDDVLRALAPDQPVTAASNRAFVARFLGNLPLNERTGLVDPAGNLSADGVRRIENALLAAAYGDVDAAAVRKFAEATDDNTRSIVGALADVAGKWLTMRRAIERGEISPDFDMTPELTEALRKLSMWRDAAAREGRPVAKVILEGMAQGDLLTGGGMPGVTKLFVRSFYADNEFTRAAGRETIASRLGDLVDAALDLGQPDFLGDAYAATKLGVLKRVYSDLETDFLEATDLRTGTDNLGPTGGQSRPGANGQVDRPGVGQDGSGGATQPASPAERVASVKELIAAAPDRSFDDLYAAAPEHQASLDEVGKAVAGEGIEWRNPGIKKRATAEEKMARKRYDSTKRVTDIVRGGFVVATPDDAERAIAALAKRFTVVDEGWQITQAGYFDRKVLVRFDDGMIGEVQIWHPDMLEAKNRGGHKLYEDMRGLAPDDPKFLKLLDEQRALYLDAVKSTTDDWLPVLSRLVDELDGGRPASGNASSKAASESLTPESTTSAASTSSQAPPSDTMAQADLPLITAGRDSQSKNVVSMPGDIGRPVVDMQEPRAPEPPAELAAAAARVGRSEDMRALADQFGVDESGSYLEADEIAAMREDGRLTADDIAELDAADKGYADAEAWAETLRVAAACVMG
mgnify:CR=1 FL=1